MVKIEDGVLLGTLGALAFGCAPKPAIIQPIQPDLIPGGLSGISSDRIKQDGTEHPMLNNFVRFNLVPLQLYNDFQVTPGKKDSDIELYRTLWGSEQFGNALKKLVTQFPEGTFNRIYLNFSTNFSITGYSFWVSTDDGSSLVYTFFDENGLNSKSNNLEPVWLALPKSAEIKSDVNGITKIYPVKDGFFTPMATVPTEKGDVSVDPRTGILMLSDIPEEQNIANNNYLMSHFIHLNRIIVEQIKLNRNRQPMTIELYTKISNGKEAGLLKITDRYGRIHTINIDGQ